MTYQQTNRIPDAPKFVREIIEEGKTQSALSRVASKWQSVAGTFSVLFVCLCVRSPSISLVLCIWRCSARAQEEKEIKLRAAVAHVNPSVVRVAMKWKRKALGEAASTFASALSYCLSVYRS